MLHPIAYKDCKTESDFRAYNAHKAALAKCKSTAYDLQSDLLGLGLIDLVPELNALIDKIWAAEADYTKDETADCQAVINECLAAETQRMREGK